MELQNLIQIVPMNENQILNSKYQNELIVMW